MVHYSELDNFQENDESENSHDPRESNDKRPNLLPISPPFIMLCCSQYDKSEWDQICDSWEHYFS